VRSKGFVSAALFGLVFTACGCLASYIFGQQTTLTCTRLEPIQIECVKQSKWAGLLPLGEESIRHLQGAGVAQSCDEDGCTYRVELDTTEGTVPLTAFYSSGSKSKQETADRIDAFVQNSRERSLTVKSDAGLLGFLLPCVFIFAGPLIAFSGLWRAIRH
jgi:hypothetical protein